MSRLTLDQVRDVLPELDELRPLVDHMIVHSEPDPARTWRASARLDTVGSRLVAAERAVEDAARLARSEAEHLGALYATIGTAVDLVGNGDRDGAADALLEAAALEEARDRPGRAAAYARAAYELVREQRDRTTATLALRRWARAARSLGDLAVARERYTAAHEAATALSDWRGAAEGAVGAGNVLEEQGRWREARAWYERALDALENIPGPAPERWHALLCVHIVTRSEGAADESEPWLERAHTEAALTDPEVAAPYLENARGQLLMARGEFLAAETNFRKALAAASDARARATIRVNLAEATLAVGRTLDAAEHAREAEREAIAAGLVKKLPEVYRVLGRIASEEGDADAFVLFERALEIVRERALPRIEEALTLQAYAACERRSGNPSTAKNLQRRAQESFSALGIEHMRHEWADVFGPTSTTTDLPGAGDTDE